LRTILRIFIYPVYQRPCEPGVCDYTGVMYTWFMLEDQDVDLIERISGYTEYQSDQQDGTDGWQKRSEELEED
jgi:hypothetical protein